VTAFLTALVVVFLAEMGDKTQLLALAFAARIRWQTVLLGIFAATAVNHLLAVYVGNFLTYLVPLRAVKIAAAASFILFGLWTLRGDKLENEDKRFQYSPFWTVCIAFFLAEMGDKTQLATVALAADYAVVIPVWAGTTAGMLTADALAIIAGIMLHKRMPEKQIKWAAASLFICFGIWGLYQSLALQ